MNSFQKTTALLLLASYGILAIGGSGLHHAPVFGLHCCSTDDSHVAGHTCCCDHSHEVADEHQQDIEPVFKNGQNSQWTQAHECQFCDFYSISYANSPAFSVSDLPLSVEQIELPFDSQPTREPNAAYPRGPPLFAV